MAKGRSNCLVRRRAAAGDIPGQSVCRVAKPRQDAVTVRNREKHDRVHREKLHQAECRSGVLLLVQQVASSTLQCRVANPGGGATQSRIRIPKISNSGVLNAACWCNNRCGAGPADLRMTRRSRAPQCGENLTRTPASTDSRPAGIACEVHR